MAEDDASPATWMAYALALAWLVSYTCFLWVESVPTELPCAWGAHGCAPHRLCEAGWPSFVSLPSCELLAPRALPRNHPPVPGGTDGLCAAALESIGTARWQLWLSWTAAAAALCVGCRSAARRSRRHEPYEPLRPPNLDAWLVEHARAPTGERARQHQSSGTCTCSTSSGRSMELSLTS